MEYKVIQQKDTLLVKFNHEINTLLKEGWTLHGDLRITVIEKDGAIVYTQVLQKEEEKKPMGFNVFLTEKEEKKIRKTKKVSLD